MIHIHQFYYIPLSSWSVNSLFATESLSPHFFYQQRQFGSARNQLATDQERPLQFENCLLLYPQPFFFKPLKGNALFLAVRKSSIQRDTYFEEKNGLGYYYKTIYLRRDTFFLCVANESHQKLILADASPSIEVKTIEKYLHFRGRSSFLIIEQDERFNLLARNPQLYYPDQVFLSRRSASQPSFDRAFNQVKGFIYGLLLGTVGGKKDEEIALEKSLQELQNEITATRGRVELKDTYADELFNGLKLCTEVVAGHYRKVYGKEQLQPFELLRNYIAELLVYTNKQKQTIEDQRSGQVERAPRDSDKLILQLEEERVKLALQQETADRRLKNIKEQLKACGRSVAHTEQREDLKADREQTQDLKKNLRVQFSVLGKKINSLHFRQFAGPQRGRTEYDGNIDDIYSKMSRLVTQLAFTRQDDFAGRKRTRRGLELQSYRIDIQRLTKAYFQQQSICADPLLTAFDTAAFDDNFLFAIIINKLLLLARGATDPTEVDMDRILRLIYAELEKVGHDTACAAIQELQRYRSEKSFEYILPEDGGVLRCFIAFIFKPGSLEELQRFLYNKNVGNHYIAYCFWGAFNGFARLPKTFTSSIFNAQNETLLDAVDDYLFGTYLKPDNNSD
jgi:hypothetical protein